MKVVLGLLVVFVALAAATPARVVRQDKYTTKYDNIDLDSILKNDRLLNNYINCLLGKGNCTPEGTELKSKFYLSAKLWLVVGRKSFWVVRSEFFKEKGRINFAVSWIYLSFGWF